MRDHMISESEALEMVERAALGDLRAIDAREDLASDSDPLGDARRIGERLSEGFEMLGIGPES